MAKILLDFVMPITVTAPTPQASTAFLKQVCLVCKPKSGQEGNVGQMFECTNMTQVAARTDNENAEQLFNAGMNKVFLLLSDDLDLADAMNANLNKFYTVLASDDFVDADVGEVHTPAVKAELKVQDILFKAKTAGVAGNSISITYVDDGTAESETVGVVGSAITVHMEAGVSTAQNILDAIEAESAADDLVEGEIDEGDEDDVQDAFATDNLEGGANEVTSEGDSVDLGLFKGVFGFSTQDDDFAAQNAAIENRVAFFSNVTNKAKNMCYAFGSLLSNAANWLNQQYISMPFSDDVDELGEANSLFDDKVSFVIDDDEFAKRLALFAVGGKAIVAPYILKNLRIDLQSRTLQWIASNQPQYTLKEASLLETRLQEDVINSYIARGWISGGTVSITLLQQNFVANGTIEVPEPNALWRVVSEMRQTP